MIRIIHLVSSLSKGSGVMSVIMNYYRNIERNNIQFDFCYFVERDNTYEEEIINLGGKTYYFSKPGFNNKFKKELSIIFKNNINRYNAIHIHEVFLTAIIAPIAKKQGIKNIITHAHNTMYSDKLLSSIRNRLLCLPLKKHANYYFACSRAAGEFLYGKKHIDSKVIVINNAIECEKYKFNNKIRNEIREKFNLENNFVIGHVGRFNEQKNHTLLIKIFKSVKQQVNNAKLILVGDGPLFSKIKEEVKELDLENDVVFLGKRNNISDLLSSMDVFLLPSLFEGLPVVGVEAQASGLPIVLSTAITKEIGLLNYKYIDLKKTPEYWAKETLSIKQDNSRNQAYLEVKEKGFDIKQEAKKLEKIYLEM